MDNVVSLVTLRKIKGLEKSINEMNEVAKVLKSTLNGLQPHVHYSSIKRCSEDLFALYTDIKRAKQNKLAALERLKHEQ